MNTIQKRRIAVLISCALILSLVLPLTIGLKAAGVSNQQATGQTKAHTPFAQANTQANKQSKADSKESNNNPKTNKRFTIKERLKLGLISIKNFIRWLLPSMGSHSEQGVSKELMEKILAMPEKPVSPFALHKAIQDNNLAQVKHLIEIKKANRFIVPTQTNVDNGTAEANWLDKNPWQFARLLDRSEIITYITHVVINELPTSEPLEDGEQPILNACPICQDKPGKNISGVHARNWHLCHQCLNVTCDTCYPPLAPLYNGHWNSFENQKRCPSCRSGF